MTPARQFDLGEGPDAQRVISVLQGMRPGMEAVLRFSGRPFGVMESVVDCCPGRYQFTPLERGPCDWRYQVAVLDPQAPPTVSSYMQWDHDRFDEILDRAMDDVACENWRGALERIGEFRDGLARHADIEERILFPRFEEITGAAGEVTTDCMHLEHQDIFQAVESMLAGAQARDADEVEGWYVNLLGVLVQHNMREEQILYPLIDRALTRAELDGLLRSILLC